MRLRPTLLLSLFLFLPSLAGCLSQLDDGCTLHVPAPSAGSVFSYSAEGRFAHIWRGSGADWRVVNPSSEIGQGSVILPVGGRVIVSVSDTTTTFIEKAGNDVPGLRVSYWVEHPDEPNALPVHDEILTESSGEVVQLIIRNIAKAGDGKGWNQIRYNLDDPPAMFLSSLFWGLDIKDSFHVEDEFVEETGLPMDSLMERVQLDASQPRRSEGTCVSQVNGVIEKRRGYELSTFDVALTLVDGNPLPTAFELRHNGTSLLALSDGDVSPGGGVEIASRTPADEGENRIPRASVESALSGPDEGPFVTPFKRALEEARQSPDVDQWLARHPDAKWLAIEHRAGPPGGSVMDSWTLTWVSTNDTEGYEVTVQQTSLLGTGMLNRFETSGGILPNEDSRPVTQAAPRLDALTAIHEKAYGVGPEYLMLDFDADTGSISTHNVSGESYAGEDGGGFPKLGLLFWISQSVLLQEDSHSMAAVGQPVSM